MSDLQPGFTWKGGEERRTLILEKNQPKCIVLSYEKNSMSTIFSPTDTVRCTKYVTLNGDHT